MGNGDTYGISDSELTRTIYMVHVREKVLSLSFWTFHFGLFHLDPFKSPFHFGPNKWAQVVCVSIFSKLLQDLRPLRVTSSEKPSLTFSR